MELFDIDLFGSDIAEGVSNAPYYRPLRPVCTCCSKWARLGSV